MKLKSRENLDPYEEARTQSSVLLDNRTLSAFFTRWR